MDSNATTFSSTTREMFPEGLSLNLSLPSRRVPQEASGGQLEEVSLSPKRSAMMNRHQVWTRPARATLLSSINPIA